MSLLPAGIVASVAVWDTTRRLGRRRADDEFVEAGLVLGPAAGLAAVCLVVAINPPVLQVAGETLTPSVDTIIRWGLRQAATAWGLSTALLATVEAVLLATGRIPESETVVRYADAAAGGAAGEVDA